MALPYSVETCRSLEDAFEAAQVARPARARPYDAGAELRYEVAGVCPGRRARVNLRIEKFVGGGFAGQVYRVKLLGVEPAYGRGGAEEPIPGLTVGGTYAMKILIPPSPGAERFRNLIYWLGFQGPFSLQVNPAAARSGALWQKFIRRAAGIEFGTERAVVDILATFVDERLGSCGELSEWVAGRVWHFEVDEQLLDRWAWRPEEPVRPGALGSPEYRAKRLFMHRFVALLHELGAHEFARQYEWWTCKSQPNCLKRLSSEGDPAGGLTAVDFRAGLALLPVLPMSPGDVKLILAGAFRRGSLVQFDRGDLGRLQAYVDAHPEAFADMRDALEELKTADAAYRDSLIDLTHHHVRLAYDRRLWRGIFASAVQSWRIRRIVDEPQAQRLSRSRLLSGLFALLGALPVLGVLAGMLGVLLTAAVLWAWRAGHDVASVGPGDWPWTAALLGGGAALIVAGRLGRRLWGRADWRLHYRRLLTSGRYLLRALRANRMEAILAWYRAGRISGAEALRLRDSGGRYLLHLPLRLLPRSLHRFATDTQFLRGKLFFLFARPVKLYFDAAYREAWLHEMVDDGLAQGMLSDAEAGTIRRQISEPFIQKYLKSLAVHLCTLPVTQIVSLAVAIYVATRYGQTWQESWAYGVSVLALFQVTPISPGSLVRGFYGLYVVLHERNYRDYRLALWLGFWKYIGYLAFPIQMAYRYPAIARFMAGRWATGAVHVVPVFGERGALLEHSVFDLFYNLPLTLRRRMRLWSALREGVPTRAWHVPAAAAAAWLAIGQLPGLLASVQAGSPLVNDAWWSLAAAAVLAGAAVARWTGGAATGRRILLGGLSGMLIALLQAAAMTAWPMQVGAQAPSTGMAARNFLLALLWPAFYCTIIALTAATLTELFRREPRSGRAADAGDRPTALSA